ncbi:MAG: chemotaxis protein CheD [Bacteriovoracaceae bacterium]|nr:chemotaxis protein CheD [Bacteriovoracaceae bacterium]
MSKIVIGIGEMGITNLKEDEIVTYALGSCVALVLICPKTRIGAMVHVALPESHIDLSKAEDLPGYFADTGVPHLIHIMKNKGAGDVSEYVAKMVGGAKITSTEDYFEIGKRNITAIKKLLWQNNIQIKGEDVGGTISRTVKLDMNDGKTYVTSHAIDGIRRL